MQEQERQSVIDRLAAYEQRINEMMKLLGGKARLSPGERSDLEAKMKSLKEDLKRDYRAMATVAGESRLTQTEKAFWLPAVHQAMTRLRSATNTDPIRSNWFDQLYECNIDITHFLDQLRQVPGSD